MSMQKNDNMNPVILEIAKLDFNIVQGIYQEDLKKSSRYSITHSDGNEEMMVKLVNISIDSN